MMRMVDKFVATLALAVGAANVPAQWVLQNSNTTSDLRGIHSVDGKVAWASGTNGTVLRTVDGGLNWQACAIPPGAEKVDFRGVQAFDAKTAIVMSSGKGNLSRLYKTTDGCATWKLVFKDPDKEGFFDALHFSDFDPKYGLGWLLGDPVGGKFALFRTEDGGRNWYRQLSKGLHADAATQGAFAASNSSIMGGPSGYIAFASGGTGGAFVYEISSFVVLVDGSFENSDYEGRHTVWARVELPLGNKTAGSGVFSVSGHQTNEAGYHMEPTLAVGGDYTKPNESSGTAAFSIDRGKTWAAAETMPGGYRSAVAWDAAAKEWITVGPNGTDVSTDDGKNWRALKPDAARGEAADADRNWNALSLPFVVGSKGRIGKLDSEALTAVPTPH